MPSHLEKSVDGAQSDQYRQYVSVYTNDKNVVEICKANGIPKAKFINESDRIYELELFMGKFTGMSCLKYFPQLRRINLMMCNIDKIEGLKHCPNLTSLWLSENNITKLEGLGHIPKLKEFYIYGNMISKLENLNNLPRLEVLWIFNNKISQLENLEYLKSLKELWIGGNEIESIGHSLDCLHNLEKLNLAGNKIGRFKEIPFLDRLKSLKSLSLKCPNFGENPVCSLCNYQTYALYHLNNITKLDDIPVTEQARHLADATFLKKKMYYNMRIKTLKRNTRNVIVKAESYRSSRVNEINLNLNVLLRMQKELERELDEEKYLPAASDDSSTPSSPTKQSKYLKDLQLKYNVVTNHVDSKLNEIEAISQQFQDMSGKMINISKQNIRRLMVELETGGNIRLEEGKAGDVWYHSCVDLVNSRFFSVDFEPLGIQNMKVNRVTRIHNRFLRNRFETHLESMVDISDPSYKRSLEYLFYSGDGNSQELFGIIEDGFPSANHFEKQGMDTAIPLSNSVSVCELPRLLKDSRVKSKNNNEIIQGSLLIAKVFLGSFTHEQTNSRNGVTKRSSQRTTMRNKITPSKYPNYDSIYRIKSGDSKQRVWFIFDHKLILPEYLIEYEFERVSKNPNHTPKYNPVDFVLSEIKPQSDIDSMDVRSFVSPFFNFASYCQGLYDQDSDICTVALNMPPILKPRPKIPELTEIEILRICRAPSVTEITYLNLYGNGIQKIEGLSGLVNLKTLILSFNEIQRIEGLSTMINLERLELGFNLIKRIEGIESLQKLKKLELNNNLLFRLDDISLIQKNSPELAELNMKNNPFCDTRSYRFIVIRRLSSLKKFDGIEIDSKERSLAQEKLHVLTENLILKLAQEQKQISFLHNSNSHERSTIEVEEGWQRSILELDLSDLRLHRLQHFDQLSNVKKLNLSRNELTRIEGLTECMKLQELSLEDNRIIKIEGLSSLLNLRKLELGKNKIAKLENLDLLVRLTQLSIESNEIESLSGISKLVNLMELYIGNNKIESLKEIHFLKKLPKLIILDLSGNQICKQKNYRWYSIFNLRKLKVLDGISIDSTEISKAKSEFSGKITIDMLSEKVGHLKFDLVLELDLSNAGIKGLSNLEPFTHLRDLNLEQNLLPSIAGLETLTNLVILRLSANRIEANHPAKNHAFGKYLNKLVNLEILTLDSNHISSIPALQLYKLTNLRVLSLRGNDIQKVEGLDGLYQLQELLLDKNKIRYIDEKSLACCPNLRQLHIEENSLRTLDGLKDLQNLHSLFLGCNRIVDLAELDKLTGLIRLKEIVLSFNPIARKSLYRPSLIHRIPSLLFVDGKEVLPEERERSMLFFAQDYFSQTPNPVYQQPTNPNSRVPVRISSVNFEYAKENQSTLNAALAYGTHSNVKTAKDLERLLSHSRSSSRKASRSRSNSSRDGKPSQSPSSRQKRPKSKGQTLTPQPQAQTLPGNRYGNRQSRHNIYRQRNGSNPNLTNFFPKV